jgi:4a-hydroxytetrahydrobiopterin dehydratase
VPPLEGEAIEGLLREVAAWEAVEEHHLVKSFRFKDFKTALDFVNRVGELSEREWHHPDLALAWGKVDIKIYTHKIDGLSDNDFILAAKIDRLYLSAAGRKSDRPR